MFPMEVPLWPRVHVTLTHLLFLISVLKLFVETLLIALQYHIIFLLEQHFTFAVASLLTWNLLFNFFQQSIYRGSGRNSNKGNPSSKLATILFMGYFPYKYFHKEFLCITVLPIHERKRQFTSLKKGCVLHCAYIHELQIKLEPVTHGKLNWTACMDPMSAPELCSFRMRSDKTAAFD
jgi:hypothetical protein